MSAHTPGPWGLADGNNRSDKTRHFVWSNAESREDREDGADWCIAIVNPRASEAVLNANAALIAAAPDLLAALRLCRDDLLSRAGCDGTPVPHACEVARAAIARATGVLS